MKNHPISYRDPAYDDIEAGVTQKLGLPVGLLTAIRTKGEKSNADQVSSSGARTAYQVIPATRRAAIDKYGIDPWLSAENAAEVAGRLLKDSLDRNKGSVTEAVAEYHAGTNPKSRGPVNRAYVARVTGGAPAPVSGGSTFDRAKAAQAANTDQGPSIAKVYEAYRAGKLSPQEKAEFEADVNSGSVLLPRGASIGKGKTTQALPAGVVAAYNSNRSEMTPQERDQIDSDIAEGLVALPSGAKLTKPENPTFAEGLGMGARGLMTGAAQVADLVTLPIRAPVDAIAKATGNAPVFGSYAETANQGADALDLMKPRTPGEKLLNGAIEGTTGGLLTYGLGGALSAAPGVTGAVGKALAASPLDDVAAGATGGLAQEQARQSGAGPVVQTLAALAGGLGGVAGVKSAEALLARVGPKAAKVLETTPKSVLVDEAGELTEDGIEAAVRAEVSPDEFKAAIEEVHAPAPDAPVAQAVDEVAPQAVQEAPPVAATPDAPISPVAPATSGARAAEAASEGVTLSRGQAEQDFATQVSENQLKASTGPEADEARQFFAKQQEDLQASTLKFRERFGDPTASPAERGATVKESLREMQDQGAKGVTAAYKEGRDLAEAASSKAGSNSAALLDLDAAPIQAKMKELLIDQIVPSETRAGLRQIAAQYGLIGKGARTLEDGTTVVEIADVATGKTGGSIPLPRPVERLSITNAENFRKDVNALFRGDNTGRSQSLKPVLDDAFNAAVERAASEGTGGIGEAFKTARKTFQEHKKTFSAKDAVNRVIDFKKGTQTDQVFDESVIKEIFKSAADLKKVKAILLSSPTAKSKEAWRAIQAHGVGDLFDRAFVLNANGGSLSGAKLNTAINKFGVDKLKVLLDQADFDQLMKLKRIAGDATIPIGGTTNPSGSGWAVIRFMAGQASRLARVAPIVGPIVDTGAMLLKQGKQAAETTKTLEGIKAFKPANDAAPVAAKTKADPAKFIRDFIDLTKSEEFIAPAFATAASAGEHP